MMLTATLLFLVHAAAAPASAAFAQAPAALPADAPQGHDAFGGIWELNRDRSDPAQTTPPDAGDRGGRGGYRGGSRGGGGGGGGRRGGFGGGGVPGGGGGRG